ncbi:hypothetical protein DH2020_004982 [Rehmannia glutinosa]|uniref:Apyrase n=1 Tax=Rehmannia glutinosa TaxID=99300 RepID=A0ABR0XQY4_REHGL
MQIDLASDEIDRIGVGCQVARYAIGGDQIGLGENQLSRRAGASTGYTVIEARRRERPDSISISISCRTFRCTAASSDGEDFEAKQAARVLVRQDPEMAWCHTIGFGPSPTHLLCALSHAGRSSTDSISQFSPNFMSKRYAVIFDAGSSGSRVHVFCFNQQLDLVPMGQDLELFLQCKMIDPGYVWIDRGISDYVFFRSMQIPPVCCSWIVGRSLYIFRWLAGVGLNMIGLGKRKPGLSGYAKDPAAAANSLSYLLEKAEAAVPQELRYSTPVRVGATAGLRQLEGDTSDRILQAVRDFLKNKSALKSKADWVTVLDGNQEGAYQWLVAVDLTATSVVIPMLDNLRTGIYVVLPDVTINYLLGNLGKKYSSTVGVVDLGGGSVQMAYAISEADAAKAPKLSDGEDSYVQQMYLKGRKYHLYVHSYLRYGLLAARAEILKVDNGSYKYGQAVFKASALPSGSSLSKCRETAIKALKVNESSCTHMKCTFGGVWNGGGGDGQKNLFVASFFFDRAAEAGFIDPSLAVAKVHPADFEDAAKRACETRLEDARSIYPRVEPDNLPYLCMDLVYQFTLLVDGFGLDPWQEITLVKKVKYQDSLVEAAWPLGSAIEAVSSPA